MFSRMVIATDPSGPAHGEERVLRGGCYKCAFTGYHPARRASQYPVQMAVSNGIHSSIQG